MFKMAIKRVVGSLTGFVKSFNDAYSSPVLLIRVNSLDGLPIGSFSMICRSFSLLRMEFLKVIVSPSSNEKSSISSTMSLERMN